MKTIFIFLLVFWGVDVLSQENKNVTLLDHWHQDSLTTSSSNVRYSGCFGFVHNNQEYAVIGSTEGAHFFQLSSSNILKEAGFIEGRFNSAQVIHREYKKFKNYIYAVCDEGTSSLQIIDISTLPDSVHLVADLQDQNFGKTHTLFIDTTNELLYLCLVTPIVNGNFLSKVPMRVYSLATPLYPQLLWEGPEDLPEVHDLFVRNNSCILNCGTNGLRVYDFTNPSAPAYLNNLIYYQDQGYNHQGWLSNNGKTYVFTDETSGMRIKKCSVDNSWNIQVTSLFGSNYQNGSIPHNLMISDTFAFVAYYNEGLKIYDIRENPVEIGSYDTYLTNSTFKMNGAWGIYSDYISERVIVSDRQSGLFLFEFKKEPFRIAAKEDWCIYPNPSTSNTNFTLRAPSDNITRFQVSIFDSQGRCVHKNTSEESTTSSFQLNLSIGLYPIWVEYENYLGERVSKCLKLSIY